MLESKMVQNHLTNFPETIHYFLIKQQEHEPQIWQRLKKLGVIHIIMVLIMAHERGGAITNDVLKFR